MGGDKYARAPQNSRFAAAMAWLAPLALGALGVLLILLRQANFGAGLTWDSGSYLSVARNLLAGNGFLEWNGTRYTGSVPIFPLLLAAVGLFGIDMVDAAGYVNAAAFGLTVCAVVAWLLRHVRTPLLAVWAGCACALSPALASAAAHAWNEIVFVLFVVVSLSLLDRFLSAGKSPVLLLAAIAAAAACLTRYVGLTLIGAGALILCLRSEVPIRTRIRDAAIWSVASTTLFGVWILRNMIVLGTLFGANNPNEFSVLISLHNATGELAQWLLGRTGSDLLNGTLGSAATVPSIAARIALLTAPAIGAAFALARYRPGFLRTHRTVLTVAIVFVATYALFLAIFLPLDDTTLPTRYLLPLFPPLLVVSTMVLDHFLAKKIGKAVPVVVSVVISLWLVWQVDATRHDIRGWLDYGKGYTSRIWTESDVIRYLNDSRLTGAYWSSTPQVWSSDPQAIYFHTELRRVSTIALSLADVKDQLTNRDPAESAYVVLFDISFFHRDYDYGFDDLEALPAMEPVAYLDNGAIFRVGDPADSTVPSGARLADAVFDIQLLGGALRYFKEPCTEEDLQDRFFLHVFPVDAADIPVHGKESQEANFDNLDFRFQDRGALRNGRCVAIVTLPEYRISRITSGQYVPGEGQLWSAEITEYQLRPSAYRRVHQSILAGDYGAPAARSTFDVYLAGNQLTYLKEPCAAGDVRPRFFLRVVPADPADLPPALRRLQRRFETLDFPFYERGDSLDGTCVAVVPLPDYEIARIRTGQYVPGAGRVWNATFSP